MLSISLQIIEMEKNLNGDDLNHVMTPLMASLLLKDNLYFNPKFIFLRNFNPIVRCSSFFIFFSSTKKISFYFTFKRINERNKNTTIFFYKRLIQVETKIKPLKKKLNKIIVENKFKKD